MKKNFNLNIGSILARLFGRYLGSGVSAIIITVCLFLSFFASLFLVGKPTNTHLGLLITAVDVLHSWAIPSFGGTWKKNFSKKKKKEYNLYKSYSCKHSGDGKCCQAAFRRFHNGKIICCYENGCYPEPCFECFRNKINGFNY